MLGLLISKKVYIVFTTSLANASPSALCLTIPCRKDSANLINRAESTGHASRIIAVQIVSKDIWVCLKNEDALESMAMKSEVIKMMMLAPLAIQDSY